MKSPSPAGRSHRSGRLAVAAVMLITIGVGTACDPPPTGGRPPGCAADQNGPLRPAASLDANGPYSVTVDQNAGASSWVFRPTTLGADGESHPVFVWGTGATSVPSQYRDHFTRMASHGLVIISPNTGSVNAGRLTSSLNWLMTESCRQGSIYFHKLNVGKIAMGGHSLGSVSTFNAEQNETRLTTTIHIAGGSFDGQGSARVKTPTAYICGAAGDIALPQCQADFRAVRSQPTFYSELQGTGHIDAARRALPGMIGWLRWHLNGETNLKASFSPGGQFFTGIWRSQVKNWG